MSDATTIGGLAASILAMAADVAVKTGVSEGVRDAYKALRERVATWARSDVEALEKTPTSRARQVVVAQEIDKRSADDQTYVRELTVALSEVLRTAAQAGPIGIDLGQMEATHIQLGEINVEEGIGVRADEIRTGDLSIDRITVGKQER